MVSKDASALYARNIYNFLIPFINNEGNLVFQWDDEVILKSALTKHDKVLNKLITKEVTNGS